MFMKRLAVIIAIAFSLIVAVPAQAATNEDFASILNSIESILSSIKSVVASPSQVAAPAPSVTSYKRVQVVASSSLYERAAIRSTVIGSVTAGLLGTVLETTSNKDGSWMKVTYDTNVTGWTLSKNLVSYTGTLAKPAGFSGYTNTGASAVLFWNSLPAISGVAGSRLYRSSASATPVLFADTGANGFYLDDKLEPNMNYLYQVSVYDKAGKESPKSDTVFISTIDSIAPTILIVSPSWSNTASGNSVYLSAHVNDNWGIGNIKATQYYLSTTREGSGTPIGPLMTAGPFNLGGAGNPNNYPGWDSTSVPNGAYYLQATTWDLQGNTTKATPVYFKVLN